MAGLLNMLRRHSAESKTVLATLQHLDREKVPIRIEIENSLTRFRSALLVRSGTVVIARPRALQRGLDKGTLVRFALPEDPERHIRMEVVTPHYNLSSGTPVFLCKMPERFVAGPKRKADRFNTSRFNNLFLSVPQLSARFRVLDLSLNGARVWGNVGTPRVEFPMGAKMPGGEIQLGNKVRVALAYVVPRAQKGSSVGVEFSVTASGNHRKYLTHLIRSLEQQELEQMRAEPI